MQTTALKTVGVVFAVVAIVHVVRVITGFTIVVAGIAIPAWASIIGVLVTGGLAIWMFRAARGH